MDADKRRLAAMAADNFQFIWRSLRRLGVPEASTDDAAQKVFEIATRRLGDIRPDAERAFLFKVAVRVAIEARRLTREIAVDAFDELPDPGQLPDETAEWKRRREVLDALLESMPMDFRTVFVLYELEGMTTLEIAALLSMPRGTAASRLRRARQHFDAQVKRLQASRRFGRGEP